MYDIYACLVLYDVSKASKEDMEDHSLLATIADDKGLPSPMQENNDIPDFNEGTTRPNPWHIDSSRIIRLQRFVGASPNCQLSVQCRSTWKVNGKKAQFDLFFRKFKAGKRGNRNSGWVLEWCSCLWWKCCQLISDGEMECFALAVFLKDGLWLWAEWPLDQTEFANRRQTVHFTGQAEPASGSFKFIIAVTRVSISYVNGANSSRPLWMWGK